MIPLTTNHPPPLSGKVEKKKVMRIPSTNAVLSSQFPLNFSHRSAIFLFAISASCKQEPANLPAEIRTRLSYAPLLEHVHALCRGLTCCLAHFMNFNLRVCSQTFLGLPYVRIPPYRGDSPARARTDTRTYMRAHCRQTPERKTKSKSQTIYLGSLLLPVSHHIFFHLVRQLPLRSTL